MQEAIESFILYLATERGLSDNYQISTRQALEGFVGWIAATKKITDLRAVEFVHLTEYLAHRKKGGLAAASIKIIVVALKIFFRFLLQRRHIERDIAEVLPLPRIERYLPETLNEAELEQLLESIPLDQPLGLRDRAIIELLYASGLRVSELTKARLEHLHLDEKVIRVTGKGNKTRLVPLGAKARDAVDVYLRKERPLYVKRRTGSEIFLPSGGAPSRRSAAGRSSRNAPSSRGWNRMFTRICCGTHLPHIFSATEPICGSSRKCSATPTSPRRRFIPMSISTD